MTFTCRARGNPKPVIEWTKEGTPLAFIHHYRVLPSGDLYIPEVRVVDHGMYRCRASNRAGAVAATTRLTVTGNKRHLRKKNPLSIGFATLKTSTGSWNRMRTIYKLGVEGDCLLSK